jgi:hypothetical protein
MVRTSTEPRGTVGGGPEGEERSQASQVRYFGSKEALPCEGGKGEEGGKGRRTGRTYANDRDSLLRVIVAVKVQERVLVRREEGEEGTAVAATDFDNALQSSLFEKRFNKSRSREKSKERRTSGFKHSASSGNSVQSHARSLKKLSVLLQHRQFRVFSPPKGAETHPC